jgi:predicted transposase/invertase (TIGR01784 family)
VTAATTPHDALFRRVFSDPAIAGEVLRGALPAEVAASIDLGSLVLEPGSFVDEDLRATHSDLVFSARIAGTRAGAVKGDARVFVLLEHQSSPDALMPFRLLRYAVRVWDHFLVHHEGATKLPLIIPVVLHQGPGRWRAPVDMSEVLDLTGEERVVLGRYVPGWRFELDDLGVVSDQTLRDRHLRADATIALAALRDVRTAKDVTALLGRWADLVHEAGKTAAGGRALSTVLRYILEVHRGLDVQQLADLVDTFVRGSGGPIMATAHELIQEGVEKGLATGLEKGVLLGRRATLQKQLRLKFGVVPEAVVQRVEAADGATLDRWEEQILTATKLDDALA